MKNNQIYFQRNRGEWRWHDFTQVRHSTKLLKWGVCVTRSEKTFHLDPNGTNIRLEGVEYYWPLTREAIPFPPMVGAVDASTTSARYNMPLLGMPVDCTVMLNPELAEIRLSNDWLRARFWLKEDSLAVLKARFFQ
jgi:hypothetical protein